MSWVCGRMRMLFGLGLAILALGCGALPASAHTTLVNSAPAAAGQLPGNPPFLDLYFSEPVLGQPVVSLTTARDSSRIALPRAEVLDAATHVRVRLPSLPANQYVAYWRVLSPDGHLTSGHFTFAIGIVPGQGAGVTAGIDLPTAAVRWVFIMALLAALGVLVSRTWTWAPILAAGEVLPEAPVSALMYVATGGAWLQLLGYLLRQPEGASGLARIGDLTGALQTRPGVLALAELALTGAALLATIRARVSIQVITLGAAVVAAALAGHPGENPHPWAAPANVAHLLAVAVWVGGLLHLVVLLRAGNLGPSTMARGAGRYARLALVAVIAAILTGAITALAEVPLLQQLLTTSYGLTLDVKIAVIGVVLGLALVARLYALPRQRRGLQGALVSVTRIEAATLVLVLAAAAALANSAPPPTLAAAPGPPPKLHGAVLELADFDGRYLVDMRADASTVVVQLSAPDGHRPRPDLVDFHTILPNGDYIDIVPRSCGAGCITGEYPWADGRTSVLISVDDGGRHSAVGFTVLWPPQATLPGSLTRVLDALRAQPALTYREHGTTAAGETPARTASVSGEQFVVLSGLDRDTPLDYQPQPNPSGSDLLLRDQQGRLVDLELDLDGHLLHQLVVGPEGRVERVIG
ncbi:MAG: copper resistance CopC/CopD family protein [Candidatus Dormibacteria bacterium]